LYSPSNSSQGYAFEQQAVDQFSRGWVNHLLLGMLHKLPSTLMAFEPLLTVVDATILDCLRRCTSGDKQA
jgi:hypothetical protein